MAYNEKLSNRIKTLLKDAPGLEDKKMFGGVGFLINGNMACGVLNDDLIIRVGPDAYNDALDLAHTRVFDITGRAMKGWVMVSPEGSTGDKELSDWVKRGVLFARSLPKK